MCVGEECEIPFQVRVSRITTGHRAGVEQRRSGSRCYSSSCTGVCYIDDSVSHCEPAIIGTIYAITFWAVSRYHLETFLSQLKNNTEFIEDALEHYGFSLLTIVPSLRNKQ